MQDLIFVGVSVAFFVAVTAMVLALRKL